LQEKREKKTFSNVEKDYDHLFLKEKLEILKKSVNFLEFGKDGKRKKALFLLGALRCFNLVLTHNLMDIYCFFDPNCFSPTLALAREIWVYLKMRLSDPELIEELAGDSITARTELDLVLRLFSEIVKQFNIRLAYKDEQEQSKEFKNLYVIDTILLVFFEKQKLSTWACPILVNEITDNSRKLFQHICSLVGSFDFLFKHMTEQILRSTSAHEADILRVMTFCVDSCYQNEARKKFLTFLKGSLSEIKSKETKPSISLLVSEYGSDTYFNQLLSLKDSQDTNNALEHILLNAISIRDQEIKAVTADFLRSVAQFGDYFMVSCATRFLCLKTSQECALLKESGRASRLLGNCLKLLALITKNPFYKSMLIAADALANFNSVLKNLLMQGCKEDEFPILEVIASLFNPKVSINNLHRNPDDPYCIDPIPRDQLSEFCKICNEHIFSIIQVADGQDGLDSTQLSSLSSLLSTLASFFDANYQDQLFTKELSRKETSILFSLAKTLLAALKRQAKWTIERANDLTPVFMSYFRILISVFIPSVLTKETYRTKRLKQIYQLLSDERETNRFIEFIEDIILQTRTREEGSQTTLDRLWIKMSSIWTPIKEILNSQNSIESLYKTAPTFEEKDLVKKTSHYDSLFEKTYNISVPSNQLRSIDLVQDTVMATAKLNDYKPIDFCEISIAERSQPTLELTIQTNLEAGEELQAAGLGGHKDSNFIDGRNG
jgi:hypothetical protein